MEKLCATAVIERNRCAALIDVGHQRSPTLPESFRRDVAHLGADGVAKRGENEMREQQKQKKKKQRKKSELDWKGRGDVQSSMEKEGEEEETMRGAPGMGLL